MSCFSESLLESGFLLQGSIEFEDLDDQTIAPINDAGFSFGPGERLVFFGQAGPTLWEESVRKELHHDHPFDAVSVERTSAWMAAAFPDERFDVVYPTTDALIPLGQLTSQLGWGESSPLGISIHPTFGLWIAHRVAAITSADLYHEPADHESPCETCATNDCVSACPVGAVSSTAAFDLTACAPYRASEQSECAYQCLSRNACPVGAENRYGDKQMRHHYGSGLASIRQWVAAQ